MSAHEPQSREALVAWLFRKLMRNGYWTRRHCGEDDILRAVRHDERSLRILKDDIIPDLHNTGFLIRQHGDRYSLNAAKADEIKRIVAKHYPQDYEQCLR